MFNQILKLPGVFFRWKGTGFWVKMWSTCGLCCHMDRQGADIFVCMTRSRAKDDDVLRYFTFCFFKWRLQPPWMCIRAICWTGVFSERKPWALFQGLFVSITCVFINTSVYFYTVLCVFIHHSVNFYTALCTYVLFYVYLYTVLCIFILFYVYLYTVLFYINCSLLTGCNVLINRKQYTFTTFTLVLTWLISFWCISIIIKDQVPWYPPSTRFLVSPPPRFKVFCFICFYRCLY